MKRRWTVVVAGVLFLSGGSARACVSEVISGKDWRSGREVRLDPAQEEATVVAFLSAKCPCSRSHEPVLARLAKAYPKFRFIAVHSNQDEGDLGAAHFPKAELPFPVIRDRDNRLANAFGALKTPHVYVVGKDGSCLYQGGVDNSTDAERATRPYLAEALQALAAGRKPDPDRARALGCRIPR